MRSMHILTSLNIPNMKVLAIVLVAFVVAQVYKYILRP
jgi:hypothetical protein